MKFKNLEKYRVGGTTAKMELAVPLPRTPLGRVYRYSPNPDAHPRHFVLGDADPEFTITDVARARMKQEPRTPYTVCPYSGAVAVDNEFRHPDDVKAAGDTVRQAALADVEAAVADMLKGFNSRQSRNSFIRMNATVGKGHRPRLRFTRRDLLRELVCDHCARDYGVFAIGLFCPDCGAPNLRLHFARERALVGAQVDLAEAQGDGVEELAYRLLGNAHEDVLTAFEATQKAAYQFALAQRPPDAPTVKPVKNDFQNVDIATRRFAELGLSPFAALDDGELSTLRLNIQKRHIIGHNLGVVDDKFAEHAQKARVDETVELVANDVRSFAAICQKVIDGLDEWLAGAPSPAIGAPLTPLLDPKRDTETTGPKDISGFDLGVSELARDIGCWLAQNSTNGLMRVQVPDKLRENFARSTPREITKAIAELENEGLIEVSGGIGREVPQPFPKPDLYAVFDPFVFGTDPHVDACELVRWLLAAAAKENSPSLSVSSQALREAFSWEHRRFNPALSLVIGQIDSRHLSRTLDGEFAARSFFVSAEDELSLERFLQRCGG